MVFLKKDFILPSFFTACAIALGGCSFKSKSAETKLSIQIPAKLRGSGKNSLHKKVPGKSHLTPTDVDDFDCIGVNIVAGDIPIRTSPDSCAPTVARVALSQLVTVVPRSAASIQITVPSGYGRLIQLFGYMTSDGACSTVDELMLGASADKERSLPFELARTNVNLTADATVNLDLSWSSADTYAAFCTNSISDTSGCGFASKFDCSKWDQATWQ